MKHYKATFMDEIGHERLSAHCGMANHPDATEQAQTPFEDAIGDLLTVAIHNERLLVLSEYVPPKPISKEEYWANEFMIAASNLGIDEVYSNTLDGLLAHRDRRFYEEALVYLFPMAMQGRPLPWLYLFKQMQTWPGAPEGDQVACGAIGCYDAVPIVGGSDA